MDAVDLLFAPLHKQAQALHTRSLSAHALIAAHLDQIARVNPTINAITVLNAEAALVQAHAADHALAQGTLLGPLHGLPFTVKDSFDAAGLPTSAGTEGCVNAIASEDATVVARVRAAGGILLAKTNCSELVIPFETDNVPFGLTRNPWHPDRTPGGSSGGEAALIAAGGSRWGWPRTPPPASACPPISAASPG